MDDEKKMPQLTSANRESTLWTPDQAAVVFVLGGPGVGKGTQCALLVKDYKFKHLSAGDLLRAEQHRDGSELAGLIEKYIRDGNIVPMEITVQLLENAMKDAMEKEGKHKFLIDGFPRKMDQALKFEEVVVKSRFTLFFHASEAVLMERLLNRAKTSGRDDDNVESIKKRFKVFEDTSMPVVDLFEKQGRVERINAEHTPEEVYMQVKAAMAKRGIMSGNESDINANISMAAAGQGVQSMR